jgi:hypothetical protein
VALPPSVATTAAGRAGTAGVEAAKLPKPSSLSTPDDDDDDDALGAGKRMSSALARVGASRGGVLVVNDPNASSFDMVAAATSVVAAVDGLTSAMPPTAGASTAAIGSAAGGKKVLVSAAVPNGDADSPDTGAEVDAKGPPNPVPPPVTAALLLLLLPAPPPPALAPLPPLLSPKRTPKSASLAAAVSPLSP